MHDTAATLYLPGQPAQPVTLTALTCEAAAPLLGLPAHLVEVLAGTLGLGGILPDGYVVFASGEVNDDTPFNEAATEVMDGLLGEWCEVSGPVLIVSVATVPQPAPEPDMAAIVTAFVAQVRDAYAQAGTEAPRFVGNHRDGDTMLFS